jgi:hypothetical protein
MTSCYARNPRRSSYTSPPQFPGGPVARGTPTHTGEQHLRRSKSLVYSVVSYDGFRKTRSYKNMTGNISLQQGSPQGLQDCLASDETIEAPQKGCG